MKTKVPGTGKGFVAGLIRCGLAPLSSIAALIFFASLAHAQSTWSMQKSGVVVRLRGVSAVSATVAWASGDKGTFLRTTDGGETWKSGIVPGAGELDFRDVDAFSDKVAYLLAIGQGTASRIYKTVNGGETWELQFTSPEKSSFFDSMAFWNEQNGIAVSDPVNGHFYLVRTSDGGDNWSEIKPSSMPAAVPGEGAFAASGTCIAVQGSSIVWFGTGGTAARIFRSTDRGESWQVADSPLMTGKAAGIFSITFVDASHGIVVGGDYTKEAGIGDNIALTDDGGKSWKAIEGTHPSGFRSAVIWLPNRKAMIAVGPAGTDESTDGGATWSRIGSDGFHAASFTVSGEAGWAVGEKGKIARYSFKL